MMGHEGKKLLFMGQEFAQEREWSEARELDWFLLEEPLHKGMQTYVKRLLQMYHDYPCLWEIDNSWNGFEWMNADDADRSTYSFVRRGEKSKKSLLFIINMTPMKWENYQVPVPQKKEYKLVLNSDDVEFGGNGMVAAGAVQAKAEPLVLQKCSIHVDVPPYSTLVYEF